MVASPWFKMVPLALAGMVAPQKMVQNGAPGVGWVSCLHLYSAINPSCHDLQDAKSDLCTL
jgi:hypothetical protein